MSEQHTLSADVESVLDTFFTGEPIDPDIVERVRKQAEQITQEIHNQHGDLDVVVETLREARHER